ncbi:MAG: hypothetical protein MHM6MM_002667 [Cercozoa sp. M6MM]
MERVRRDRDRRDRLDRSDRSDRVDRDRRDRSDGLDGDTGAPMTRSTSAMALLDSMQLHTTDSTGTGSTTDSAGTGGHTDDETHLQAPASRRRVLSWSADRFARARADSLCSESPGPTRGDMSTAASTCTSPGSTSTGSRSLSDVDQRELAPYRVTSSDDDSDALHE